MSRHRGRTRVITVGSLPSGVFFDSSEYRTATYGAPTHYVDPTRTTNGSGTFSSPWQPSQAMASAVGGNVVGWMDGLMSATFPATANENLPALNPANSGSSAANRIVHVTRYGAIWLANVSTNALRTQLRHNGAQENATDPFSGTGGPMYGSYGANHIIWDGFFVNAAAAQPMGDGGVIRAEQCTGVQFRNFVIEGGGVTYTMGSNAIVYRPNGCFDTVLHNFRVKGFHNNPTGSPVPQPCYFCDSYGDQNFLIEYFDIEDMDSALFIKGTYNAATVFNYGIVRYGRIFNIGVTAVDPTTLGSGGALRMNDLDADDMSEFHHILAYDWDGWGLSFSGGPGMTARNINLHHCTFAKGRNTSTQTGPIYGKTVAPTSPNITLRDNIFEWDGGAFSCAANWEECTGVLPGTMNWNFYRRHGSSPPLTYKRPAGSSIGIAAWASDLGSGREANSSESATDPFVNRAGNNFRIAGGSALLTASSTGGQIGAYEGSIEPGPYGSYGF